MVGKIAFLSAALPVVRHHHERFDGTGYPERLAREGVPLAARIFAVADTFDAMTSDRPYRKAVSVEEAREEIARCSGTQFDPEVVRGFLTIPDARLREIRRRSVSGLGRITRAE
jgi:HD-GYP domain-containing protein (c-di-GMP phosphodiesterase class II)